MPSSAIIIANLFSGFILQTASAGIDEIAERAKMADSRAGSPGSARVDASYAKEHCGGIFRFVSVFRYYFSELFESWFSEWACRAYYSAMLYFFFF